MSEDLSEELKKDLMFNESNLLDKISNSPLITTKWSDRLIKATYQIRQLQKQRKQIVKTRTSFYSGRKKIDDRMCPLTLAPQEIRDVYIPGDEAVLDFDDKINKKKVEVEFLDFAVKQCNQNQWNIKSYIEWQKYINGVT